MEREEKERGSEREGEREERVRREGREEETECQKDMRVTKRLQKRGDNWIPQRSSRRK